MPSVNPKHIAITRIDAIGDVVLTLPMFGYLREIFPETKLSLIGRTYTQPLAAACSSIDQFINYDETNALASEKEKAAWLGKFDIDTYVLLHSNRHFLGKLAKMAKIPMRIGIANRWQNWVNCNKLVPLSRTRTDLHELELNFALLKPLGIKSFPKDLPSYYNLNKLVTLPEQFAQLLTTERFNLVLHPRSGGNALEWSLSRFSQLIGKLDPGKYRVFITGSPNDHKELTEWLGTLPAHATDLTGKLSLGELISFISASDGLVAGSTGPVHLAAATGIQVLGLYPSKKPKHGERWAPYGKFSSYLETPDNVLDSISAEQVVNVVETWSKLN